MLVIPVTLVSVNIHHNILINSTLNKNISILKSVPYYSDLLYYRYHAESFLSYTSRYYVNARENDTALSKLN